MYANDRKPLGIRRWIALLLIALIAFWYYAPPRVYIFYSVDGTKGISYILNTQHQSVKGDLLPGMTTGDVGHIFPDDKFFMEFYWWRDGERRHCINITPKWPNTHIYLDANGDIDTNDGSRTDSDRLKQCFTDTVPP